MNHRVAATAAALALLAPAAAGCGRDEPAAAPERATAADDPPLAGEPFVSRDEAFALMRDAGLRLQRTRASAGAAAGADPRPVSSARYAEKSGAQFDLFVFESPAAARRAEEGVGATRATAATALGANLLAAFPETAAGNTAYTTVEDLLRRLDDACGRPDGDAQLREVCLDDPAGDAEPAADTVAALPRGSTLRLGSLTYTPTLSRRLNAAAGGDRPLVDGRDPASGEQWFAAWVRVCNEGSQDEASDAEVALVSGRGVRVEPEAPTLLDDDARPIPAGRCEPQASTPAELVRADAVVVFGAPADVLGQIPLALELRRAGETGRVELDG